MLEKSSWSHSSNGCFPSSLDGDTKSRMPSPCVRSTNMKSCDNVDQTVKQYQLNESSCIGSDLTFFGNGLEEKHNNDQLFYCWPDLENFDDVDDVFRGCDSTTFGLDIDNSDHFNWLPSSPTIKGSTDSLMSSFDIPICNPCGPSTITELQENKAEGQEIKSESHAIPSKHQNSLEGIKRDHSLENDVSLIQFDQLRKTVESNHLSNMLDNFSSENHQQEIIHQPCLQTSMSMIKPNSSHPSTQVLPESTTSLTESEFNVLPTMSPRDSSHLSNQMQFISRADDVSSNDFTHSENTKKRKLHQHKSSRQTEKTNLVLQRAGADLLCVKNTIPAKEKAECQRKVDGSDTGFSGELDYSCGGENKESSCMSSVLDEFSIDSGGLKQLQHATVQMDIRTKLCIRDSLYRLARSAAQRHNCDNHNNVERYDKDGTGALLSNGTSKCVGFIDVETDTNPVDRSIAHLLFHRPSDPSAAAPIDCMPVKCSTMVQPPGQLTADKPMCSKVNTLG